MRVTRRYWAVAVLGLFLAALAALLARPVLLVGAAAVGAWLLARQYLFVRRLVRADAGLSVEQSLPMERTRVDETVPVALSVALDRATPLELEIAANPPIGVTSSAAEERSLALDPGETEASTTFTVRCPVAGEATFDPPTVRITDPAGLFVETIERGSPRSVIVQPRAPRNVHVGEGGEEVAAAFGEHSAGRIGTGLEPAELREYAPGDALSRIDWKATARLDHPHVREYEAETDRETVLLVDHRGSMAVGGSGETKLDYGRGVALAFLQSARELGDPLGFYAVGDGGITARLEPESNPDRYAAIERALNALEPTAPSEPTGSGSSTPRPADARRAAVRLERDGGAFGTTLRPYFEAIDPYVRRIEADPLFATARECDTRLGGSIWSVIVTDDTARPEIRETVSLARRGDDHVLVFLTPDVLFEPGGLGDLEAAYERYLDFEEFRRELAKLDRVSAFEVAPGDRIDAILAARRRRRSTAGGT